MNGLAGEGLYIVYFQIFIWHIWDKTIFYLEPGECHWGEKNDVITTVLGSCVAICLWHPKIYIGGMSHVKLTGKRISRREVYNLHYSDDVIWFIIDKIYNLKTSPEDYVVKLFGGSSMFKTSNKSLGDLLVRDIINRLINNGFRIQSKNIGGNFARKLYFVISTGHVWMKNYGWISS